jgi:hypothetical protein
VSPVKKLAIPIADFGLQNAEVKTFEKKNTCLAECGVPNLRKSSKLKDERSKLKAQGSKFKAR